MKGFKKLIHRFYAIPRIYSRGPNCVKVFAIMATAKGDSHSDGRRSAPERSCVPTSQGGVNGVNHLTPRELEVLNWVGEGKRDAEIAILLRVSVRTVNKHVQSILSKLHVETRTAAARYAMRIAKPDVDRDGSVKEEG